MATPIQQAQTTGSDTIIAGYFTNGEDAHRAINALLDEGFLASQIGAAFHTSGGAPGSTGAGASSEAIDTTGTESRMFNEEGRDVDTSAGGASSDSGAVQPIGLSSGSGSPILGAGKPGPITGSELTHTGLRSELRSELAHDRPGSRREEVVPLLAGSGSTIQRQAAKSDTSWTSKLKHLFSKSSDTPSVDTDDQKFGTGEGQMDISRPYSRNDFESSIQSAGVHGEQSRRLSHHLSSGGAVVTVNSTGRAVEVERIFEQYSGVVRFESDIFEDAPALGSDSRVEYFGHLEHRYPVR